MQRLTTKHGEVVRQLAGSLLAKQCGDRVSAIEELSRAYGVGRGTVQTALRYIQEADGVRLRAKGHLGTFVDDIDRARLWALTGRPDVFALLPLIITRQHVGLAAGIHQQLRKPGVPFSVAYMRGGKERLWALVNGRVDMVLASSHAVQTWPESGQLEIISELQTSAAVGEHVLVLADPNKDCIEDGMTVAVDPKSADHLYLTQLECGSRQVSFVELSYTLVLDAVAAGAVDAAVWAVDPSIPQNPALHYHDLSEASRDFLRSRAALAVLVTRRGDEALRSLFEGRIDAVEIVGRQQLVQSGGEIPEI